MIKGTVLAFGGTNHHPQTFNCAMLASERI
jgi:hypothetical protein